MGTRAAASRTGDNILVRGDVDDARSRAAPEDLALGDLDFALCSERCSAGLLYIVTVDSCSAMVTIPGLPLGALETARLSAALGLGAWLRSSPLLADPVARSPAGAVFERIAAGLALYGSSLLLLCSVIVVTTGFAA